MSAETPLPPEPTAALVQKYDRPGPRYTSYPTVPVWTDGFQDQAWLEALAEADRREEDRLALYLHLPFCRHRCLFCACNVVITQREDVVEAYLARLEQEIRRTAERLPNRRRVSGVHWGGGTPTHLSVQQMERLWSCLQEHFQIDHEGEIAIEVHPPVTTPEQLQCLRSLGFRRISLGVQDLDTGVQEIIERWQSVEQTESLLALSRELGFESANFDLIYGLPGQSPQTWDFTLDQVLRMRPDRLAIYSYAKVPWIKPHQKRMAEDLLPDPEVKMSLFRHARRRLLAGGYQEIGMDHFALPGDELARAVQNRKLYRNFMGYTVRPAKDYIGFGASSISEVGCNFAQKYGKLNRWNQSIDDDGHAIERGFRLSPEDLVRKTIIERLMCNLFVDFREVENFLSSSFQEHFQFIWEPLKEMEEDGLLEIGHDSLQVTALGRTLVRNIAMLFDAYLQPASNKALFSRTV
ncbi:MAG: oxygen-independent coproporphyrinogen III oxidase [Planctomycetota bacterium]|nr:MAG: oxygen-independent coproporphyrinogen III oxidase [Planctomycetota bacterium]